MHEDSFYQSEITDMHEMYMHVNRVDLRIKALIALEVDDPEDCFFLYNDTTLYSKTLVSRQSGSVVSM